MIKKLLTKLKILKKEVTPEERFIEMMLLSAVCVNSKKIIVGDPVENIPRKYLNEDSRGLPLENQYLKLSDLDKLDEQENIDIFDIVENHSYNEIEKFMNEHLAMPGKVPVWYVKDDELCLSLHVSYWIYSEAKKYFDYHDNKVDLTNVSLDISTTEESDYTYSINLKY